MAKVIRYFSTTGAGSEDGTSWANRAVLYPTNTTLNSIITSFSFAGSDSLEVRIGPGNYTTTQVFNSTALSPTATNSVLFAGCDSSGDLWLPPAGWTPAQTLTHDAKITHSGAGVFIDLANATFYGLNLESSRNGAIFSNGNVLFCKITNTSSTTGASVQAGGRALMCWLLCTGTSFSLVVSTAPTKCRIEGNSVATTGNRRGYSASTASVSSISDSVFVNIPNQAILNSSTGSLLLHNCLLYNCGTGIEYSSTSELGNLIVDSVFVELTTAIKNVAGNTTITRNRLRDNTTNFDLGTHSQEFNNITAAGTDADEFVDATNGDFRIKFGSDYWGKELGPADELLDPTVLAEYLWTTAGRTLT